MTNPCFRCDECNLRIEGIVRFILHKETHGPSSDIRKNGYAYFPTTTSSTDSCKEKSVFSMEWFIPRIEITPLELFYKRYQCEFPSLPFEEFPKSVERIRVESEAWIPPTTMNQCPALAQSYNPPAHYSKKSSWNRVVPKPESLLLPAFLSETEPSACKLDSAVKPSEEMGTESVIRCSICGQHIKQWNLTKHRLKCRKNKYNEYVSSSNIQGQHSDSPPTTDKTEPPLPNVFSDGTLLNRCFKCKAFIKNDVEAHERKCRCKGHVLAPTRRTENSKAKRSTIRLLPSESTSRSSVLIHINGMPNPKMAKSDSIPMEKDPLSQTDLAGNDSTAPVPGMYDLNACVSKRSKLKLLRRMEIDERTNQNALFHCYNTICKSKWIAGFQTAAGIAEHLKRNHSESSIIQSSKSKTKVPSDPGPNKSKPVRRCRRLIEVNCPHCTLPIGVRWRDWKHHITKCYTAPPFQCWFSLCCGRFDESADLLSHVITTHMQATLFKCNECGKILCSKDSLNRHVLKNNCYKSHSGKDVTKPVRKFRNSGPKKKWRWAAKEYPKTVKLKCPRCSILRVEQNLHSHFTKCFQAPPFQCDFPSCAKVFPDSTPLVIHVLKYHTNLVECEKCGRYLRTKEFEHMHSLHCRATYKLDHGSEALLEPDPVEPLQTVSVVLVPYITKLEKRQSRTKSKMGRPSLDVECEYCGLVLRKSKLAHHRRVCNARTEIPLQQNEITHDAIRPEGSQAVSSNATEISQQGMKTRNEFTQVTPGGVVIKMEEDFFVDYEMFHADQVIPPPGEVNRSSRKVKLEKLTASKVAAEVELPEHMLRKSQRCVERISYAQMKTAQAHENSLRSDVKASNLLKMEGSKAKGIKASGQTEMRKKYPCSVCGTHVCGISMPIHRKHFHPEVKPFQCFHCPFQTVSKTSISKHRHKYHSQSVRDSCSTSTEIIGGWKLQGPTGRTGFELKCPCCKFQGTSAHALSMHVQFHHPTPYKCERCPFTASELTELREHSECHTRDSLKCGYCTVSFKMAGGLFKHIQKIHPEVYQKPIVSTTLQHCPICGEEIRSRVLVAQHYREVHAGINPSQCRGYPYGTAFSEAKHEKSCSRLQKPQTLVISTDWTLKNPESGSTIQTTANVSSYNKLEPSDLIFSDIQTLEI